EVGIDNALVIGAEEEIFEMNNGCICCTVRGDLIRILGNLMKRRDRFDAIIVETTGLADPGPVAQTFFMDDEIKRQLSLDAIVTLIDARHVWNHLDDSEEAREQIAFADVLVLNKIDLVSPEEIDRLEARVRGMNAAAQIHRARNADVALDAILNVGGFDLSRALSVDPRFMEPEYPFEWGGSFTLEPGTYEFLLDEGPDRSMVVVLVPLPPDGTLETVIEPVTLLFSNPEQIPLFNEPICFAEPCLLDLTKARSRFPVTVTKKGRYALFTEHRPEEFNASLLKNGHEIHPDEEQVFKPDHEHDDEVTSVGITLDGDLDGKRFNAWLGRLLSTHGADIFRMKGILSLRGQANRFVFQGVHMLFDGRPDRPWGKEPRSNRLIFIGRNLDRSELTEGFRACLV
ncbi:MAG: GTP-binding protein, partial [candidate division Zixibacteria bacterium]|nr:GTP-binding protein [candidate division Zixibacteria bacterium]